MTCPASRSTFTIGYDSSSPENQLVANLLSAELSSAGLSATVQSYPTAQIYGWAPPAKSPKGAPDVLLDGGWPDAASLSPGSRASLRLMSSRTRIR